jgi:hypothetical protein
MEARIRPVEGRSAGCLGDTGKVAESVAEIWRQREHLMVETATGIGSEGDAAGVRESRGAVFLASGSLGSSPLEGSLRRRSRRPDDFEIAVGKASGPTEGERTNQRAEA